MKLEIGRPSNCKERQKKEVNVYDLLDKLGIGYARIDHRPLLDLDDGFAVDRVMDISSSKNVFLYDEKKGNYYFLIMPDEKELKLNELYQQLKISELCVADEKLIGDYLGLDSEAVSVLGLMYDKENKVHLLVDREILEAKYLGCCTCVNNASIKLRIEDLINRFLPFVGHDMTVVDLTWL